MTDLSRASDPPAAPTGSSRIPRQGNRGLPKSRRLASRDQLWRLNEQGVLAIVDPGPYELGSVPVPGITNAEADVLLQRLLAERWHGLGRWARAGEAWRVEEGAVRLIEQVPRT